MPPEDPLRIATTLPGVEQDDARALVLRIGEALANFGSPSPHVEKAMTRCSRRLGLEGQFFGTPTSIFAAFGGAGRQSVGLLRIEPGGVDLGKRAAIDELVDEVASGQAATSQALDRLDRIARMATGYGGVLTTLCYGLSSAAAARFLGGGLREMLAACAVGLATGLLALAQARSRRLGQLFEPLAATVASALAVALAATAGPFSSNIVTVAGIIVLLPGLILTTAMAELAVQHLVAGATRLLAGFMTLLFLGLGVALGSQVAQRIFAGPARDALPRPAPAWTLALALLAAPICYAVLLKAPRRDFGWIVVMSSVAFGGARIGTALVGPGVGAFTGALLVGVGSSLYHYLLKRPTVIPLVPGLLVLVPGTIGFQSFSALISRDVVSGIDTALTMMIVAISLVMGVVVSQVLTARLDPDR